MQSIPLGCLLLRLQPAAGVLWGLPHTEERLQGRRGSEHKVSLARVQLAGRYFAEGADEVTFLNITGFRDFPLGDMPMLEARGSACLRQAAAPSMRHHRCVLAAGRLALRAVPAAALALAMGSSQPVQSSGAALRHPCARIQRQSCHRACAGVSVRGRLADVAGCFTHPSSRDCRQSMHCSLPWATLACVQVLRQTSEGVFVPLTVGGGIRGFTDAEGRRYSALDVAAEYFRSGADKAGPSRLLARLCSVCWVTCSLEACSCQGWGQPHISSAQAGCHPQPGAACSGPSQQCAVCTQSAKLCRIDLCG